MQFDDIQKVNQLSNEKIAIQRSIAILTSGGRISAMTVSGGSAPSGPEIPPGMGGGSFALGNSATVRTDYITYPPQMVDTIVGAFNARLQQITQELAQLGVTGVEQR